MAFVIKSIKVMSIALICSVAVKTADLGNGTYGLYQRWDSYSKYIDERKKIWENTKDICDDDQVKSLMSILSNKSALSGLFDIVNLVQIPIIYAFCTKQYDTFSIEEVQLDSFWIRAILEFEFIAFRYGGLSIGQPTIDYIANVYKRNILEKKNKESCLNYKNAAADIDEKIAATINRAAQIVRTLDDMLDFDGLIEPSQQEIQMRLAKAGKKIRFTTQRTILDIFGTADGMEVRCDSYLCFECKKTKWNGAYYMGEPRGVGIVAKGSYMLPNGERQYGEFRGLKLHGMGYWVDYNKIMTGNFIGGLLDGNSCYRYIWSPYTKTITIKEGTFAGGDGLDLGCKTLTENQFLELAQNDPQNLGLPPWVSPHMIYRDIKRCYNLTKHLLPENQTESVKK
jgi:hypothetical protein